MTARGAGVEPPAAAEVADEVAHAAVEQGQQGLRAVAPERSDVLVEKNLRGDEYQG